MLESWKVRAQLGHGGVVATFDGAKKILRLMFELIEIGTNGQVALRHNDPP
jgi:hypothetical protein